MPLTDYYLKSTCRMCGETNLEKVIELTATPPGNNFLLKEELNSVERSYPLEVYFCKKCTHLQLGHVVNPEILYQKRYSYVTGTSDYFLDHLETYAKVILEDFKISKNSLIVDIGSNDGSCLRYFKNYGMQVLGVDPAKEIAINATKSGIKTIGEFFSYKLAKKLMKEYGPCQLITSHNAFAHIDDLGDVLKGISHWLSDYGVVVIEVGYLYDIYINTWFDTIYHEHLDYHTIRPFKTLFGRFNMQIIKVKRIKPQGGSIRIIAQKNIGKYEPDDSIEDAIQLEKKIGLYEKKSFIDLNTRILEVKDLLLQLLRRLRKEGKSIAAYGAPTKATTLMFHFNIGNELIDFIVDDNPLKQGLYTPVTHIPVLHPDTIYSQKPDYLLILAWNFADQIMAIHKLYNQQIGKFIVPMPTPKVF